MHSYTPEQLDALQNVRAALNKATECGALDLLAADYIHPDTINAFCDAVDSAISPKDKGVCV